jgi:hypothetical protein
MYAIIPAWTKLAYLGMCHNVPTSGCNTVPTCGIMDATPSLPVDATPPYLWINNVPTCGCNTVSVHPVNPVDVLVIVRILGIIVLFKKIVTKMLNS